MAPTAQGPTYFYRRVWNKVKRTLLKRKNTFWSKKNFKANEHLHARLRLLVRSPSTHTPSLSHTHTHFFNFFSSHLKMERPKKNWNYFFLPPDQFFQQCLQYFFLLVFPPLWQHNILFLFLLPMCISGKSSRDVQGKPPYPTHPTTTTNSSHCWPLGHKKIGPRTSLELTQEPNTALKWQFT